MLPQWIEFTPEEEAALDEAWAQVHAENESRAQALGITVDELLAREAHPRPSWIPRVADGDDDGIENDSQLSALDTDEPDDER